MKKLIGILIAVTLLFGVVACELSDFDISKYVGSIVYGGESSNTTPVEGNIMAVFYLKADEMVLFWGGNGQIIDNGDGTWDFISDQCTARGINQASVTYGLYKYQPFTIDQDNPVYLDDLNLQAITWDDLPKSTHVAALLTMDIPNKVATVARLYMGKRYDAPSCYITQGILDAWTGGKLEAYDPDYDWKAPENADCFVLVCFIREAPYSDDTMLPVVLDKVVR